MKRVDLVTELGAPIVAGLILTSTAAAGLLTGFLIVAVWNFLSFVPEYFLLRSVYLGDPKLSETKFNAVGLPRQGLLERLRNGWRDFIAQPAAVPMLAYSLLWITILSPHGVILSAWLKAEWLLSEAQIGVFRAGGAVFGLAATVAFPWTIRRLGLLNSARVFIVFEAVTLVCAGVFFSFGASYFWFFAAFVLLSRIGLYGFSLGEIEIRQKMIDQPVKGRVNGTASALNGMATLVVYALGTVFMDSARFHYLVYGSIFFVAAGALTFSIWTASHKSQVE